MKYKSFEYVEQKIMHRTSIKNLLTTIAFQSVLSHSIAMMIESKLKKKRSRQMHVTKWDYKSLNLSFTFVCERVQQKHV